MPDSFLPQRWSAPAGVSGAPISSVAPSEHDPLLKRAMELGGLLRRHWLLVLTVALASAGMVLYQMRQNRVQYQAFAVIRLVDKSRSLSGGLGTSPSDRMVRPMFTDPVLSQLEVLKSHGVAEEVAQEEGLRLRVLTRALPPSAIDSAYVAPDAPNDTLHLHFDSKGFLVRRGNSTTQTQYGSFVSLDGVRFMIAKQPRSEDADLAIIPLTNAANEVQANLAAHARERTDVIDVSYLAYDPVVAQRVVNAAVRVFQALSASTSKQESVRRREFIEQQLAKTDGMLNDAQAAYNSFRSREKVYSSDQKARAQQVDLAEIDVKRQELDADRRMYQSLLDAFQASKPSGSGDRLAALASSPGVATNPLISQLFGDLVKLQGTRDSLTAGTWARNPNDPDVKRIDLLIASTEQKIIGAARGQVAAVDARISSLDELRKSVATQLGMLPETQAEESKLLEQVDTYKREAERLRAELQSAQINEAAEVGQVEIVDLASAPGFPIGSGRSSKIILALMLGLGLGLLAAYVLENKKSVIRKREELEHVLQIPNLAMVPQLKSSSATQGSRLLPRFARNGNGHHAIGAPVSELVTVNDRRSSVAEAYRTLRTNLLFSAAVRALRSVVVTSPGAAEGKSMTAANLAVAFAQQGHRVLLLDCDLRRPRIHRMFQQTELPGLTNILIGGTSVDETIRETKIDGLFILPAGAMPPNPAELLGSPQMRALLDQLRDRFDVVIIDSPPLLAASDGAILSRMVDGALVVVRAGRTERAALKTAIQQLATVGARVLGTVLNDPDAEVPRYADYYGYYYYSQYYGNTEVASPTTLQN